AEIGPDVHALAINLELLKGELRALQHTLDELGLAIAPAAGLDGASVRMAELRERVHALERRGRAAPAPHSTSPPTRTPPGPPAASIGASVSLLVVEHRQLEVLLELLELSVTRLVPGGLFVAETPNPASLIVLGNSYILDPTHVRPLHPSLMVFLCEVAGFRDVKLRFFSPAEDYQLPLVDDPAAPAWLA